MSEFEKRAAIVPAGDRGKSHPVFGKNKAFLEIRGVPVVTRVVMALDAAKSVSEIYIVGPKDRLEETLSGVDIAKPLRFFEQGATLYENVWGAVLETLPSYRRGETVEAIAKGPDAEGVALVTGADMPLLTGAEIDEFASKCDMENYDYVLGMTGEEDLEHYYPSGGRPGIHPASMHFREGNLRQNNLHMVRSFKIINLPYLQTLYDLRYQKEFWNMARLGWVILNKEEGGWGTLGNLLLMQLSLTSERLHLGFLRDFFRNRTALDSVTDCISRLLKTRFTVARTTLGGAALDVDCESDYEAIEERFSEWMDHQREKAEKLSIGVSPH